MGTCNKEAGDKKLEGDARKKFMSECLSADKQADAAGENDDVQQAGRRQEAGGRCAQEVHVGLPVGGQATQQEKMTTCNKQAGDKKLAGDERKKFMSSCLSGLRTDVSSISK